MKPYVNMNPSQEPTKEQLVQYSIKQLKELLAKYHVTTEVYIDDDTFFNKMFTSWYTVLPLSEVNNKISQLRYESALIIEGVINDRRN